MFWTSAELGEEQRGESFSHRVVLKTVSAPPYVFLFYILLTLESLRNADIATPVGSPHKYF